MGAKLPTIRTPVPKTRKIAMFRIHEDAASMEISEKMLHQEMDKVYDQIKNDHGCKEPEGPGNA